MGDRVLNSEEMASTSTTVATVPTQLQESSEGQLAVITLRPSRPKQRKKVVWTEDTVDNEHMNKKKSKCCCIYEKPHAFGESDSEESDDECEHCFGHVKKRPPVNGETQPSTEEPSPSSTESEDPNPSRHLKRVVWAEDTVDNEHMNKKKSKSCCVYKKHPRFGDDSDDSGDDSDKDLDPAEE